MSKNGTITESRPFVRSIDTQTLVDLLAAPTEPGTRISYATLSDRLGRDVQRVARSYLQTARRIVAHEYGKIYGVETGQGLILLDDADKIRRSPGHVRRIHNAAARAKQELATVNISSLDQDGRMQFDVAATMVSTLHAVTTAKAAKRLEGAVRAAQQQLPLAKTLEAFK